MLKLTDDDDACHPKFSGCLIDPGATDSGRDVFCSASLHAPSHGGCDSIQGFPNARRSAKALVLPRVGTSVSAYGASTSRVPTARSMASRRLPRNLST